MKKDKAYTVRAVSCHHEVTEEETYQALVRVTDPLRAAWERLGKAGRIGIKINQDMRLDELIMYKGMCQQLVCDKVVRATLRLLREFTDAEIVCTDVSYYGMYNGTDPIETATALPALSEFGVEYIVGSRAPMKVYDVPGGGQMFARYVLPEPAVECDEFGLPGKNEKPRIHGNYPEPEEFVWSHARGTPRSHATLLPPLGAYAVHAR